MTDPSPAGVVEEITRELERRGVRESEVVVELARRLFSRDGVEWGMELDLAERVDVAEDAARWLAPVADQPRWRVYEAPRGRGTIFETHVTDRPFVVDTIREMLRREGLTVRHFVHPILDAERGPDGTLLAVTGGRSRESFVHGVLEALDPARREALSKALAERLRDVVRVTDDHGSMRARVAAVREELRGTVARLPERRSEIEEDSAFLDWLLADNFVFLGCRSYDLTREGDRLAVEIRHGSGLGLLRDEERSLFSTKRYLDEIAPALARDAFLVVTRANSEAPVHRRARMDSVTVRRVDESGTVAGEERILGLFTSKAYAEESAEIPILRRKLGAILEAERAIEGTHDWKEIVQIFDSIPKHELFALSLAEILHDLHVIRSVSPERLVHIALRTDPIAGGVAILVIVPRDRFSGDLRRRIQAKLEERLGGAIVDYQLALGEGDHARLHFFLETPDAVPVVRTGELEQEITRLVRSWGDDLRDALRAWPDGRALFERYDGIFTEEYRASTEIASALGDIRCLEELERTGRPQVDFANGLGGEAEGFTVLKLFLAARGFVLSDFLPMLENLGLRVHSSDTVRLGTGDRMVELQRFRVLDSHGHTLDIDRLGDLLAETLLRVRDGDVESDPLNRLVVEAGLSWRAVDLLRLYRNVAFQTRSAPSREALTDVLVRHAAAAASLFGLFSARFDPDLPGDRTEHVSQAVEVFVAALEAVNTSGEDRMLRNYRALVEATVRTNFHRPMRPGRPWLSVKIASREVDFLPRPRPLYEIYVHGARTEGVHLRGGKIARGGIRFSDRHDDFRTEVLGLMKTQMVKNAVIVPTGSKGGFIVKNPRPGEEAAAEVRDCYSTFIRALLELTDNWVGATLEPPAGVVRYDDDDPYLVVAADKGTATFSDLANSIAAEQSFWLGDAFASGGTHGYDHKKEGITARGAWECVKRHFEELEVNVQNEPVTVAGIGDMSGDVFGNGMCLSRSIHLRAAFNHRHVFLDPDPDPEASFRERERLFALPRSSWIDYDRSAMSPGGMIVERHSKATTVTPEVRRMLGVESSSLDGEGLIRAVLTMETDLLFNGGIGTYVRGSGESDFEVGDPVNDPVRVEASSVRARVVGEGGNLGITQRGRIALAIAGTRLNTDAIDNSGGVDLSDHEVNLKILLQPLVDDGPLSADGRNRILDEVKQETVKRVLSHNARQTCLLTLDEIRSQTRISEFRDLMSDLEREGLLDRTLEALPDRETLRARRAKFPGLTRPELAVIVAYSKMSLQQRLVASEWIRDPYLERSLFAYFPPSIGERFAEPVRRHRLRAPIIALELTNDVIDRMGAAFACRITRDTGRDPVSAVAAWCVVTALSEADRLFDEIVAADVPVSLRNELLLRWEAAMESAIKLVLATGRGGSLGEQIDLWLAPVAEIADLENPILSDEDAGELDRLERAGLSSGLARSILALSGLRRQLEIAEVARSAGVSPADAALAWDRIGRLGGFPEVEEMLASLETDDWWERRAAEGLRADLAEIRRRLCSRALHETPAPEDGRYETVRVLAEDLRRARRGSVAGIFVIVRELWRLAGPG